MTAAPDLPEVAPVSADAKMPVGDAYAPTWLVLDRLIREARTSAAEAGEQGRAATASYWHAVAGWLRARQRAGQPAPSPIEAAAARADDQAVYAGLRGYPGQAVADGEQVDPQAVLDLLRDLRREHATGELAAMVREVRS